jgi:hypothetical protein
MGARHADCVVHRPGGSGRQGVDEVLMQWQGMGGLAHVLA